MLNFIKPWPSLPVSVFCSHPPVQQHLLWVLIMIRKTKPIYKIAKLMIFQAVNKLTQTMDTDNIHFDFTSCGTVGLN